EFTSTQREFIEYHGRLVAESRSTRGDSHRKDQSARSAMPGKPAACAKFFEEPAHTMTGEARFTGKAVIVTGAGHGIGRAIAERFWSEGASVVVNDVDRARAVEVAEALGAGATDRLLPVGADVSSSKEVDAMFAAAVERFGTIDILVNNAGLIGI